MLLRAWATLVDATVIGAASKGDNEADVAIASSIIPDAPGEVYADKAYWPESFKLMGRDA